MKKIGVIHTTPATLGLKELIIQEIADASVINILDDSILPDMLAGTNVDFVARRWQQYAKTLEELGAEVIFCACSTVGEIAEAAQEARGVPILRIDEAMAEQAVGYGTKIGVLATLASTLKPTIRLIERKAQEGSKLIEIDAKVIAGAYDALQRGERMIHDQLIREAIRNALLKNHVVVLAQASMAAALLDEDFGGQVLTSPDLGVKRLKKMLEYR
jgi:aspartate/glutamate racemase